MALDVFIDGLPDHVGQVTVLSPCDLFELEDFWSRYGGQVEANWESAALRQYSSLDSESLAELVHDPAWSNEGLFALLQGLRRLKQIGGNRVRVPTIEWQLLH